MTELEEIGRNIVLLRRSWGLTQEEMAYRANLSVSRLQAIEYGCQNATVDTMMRIARSFEIDSRILGIFSRIDRAILSEFRHGPQLPKQEKGMMQICENIRMLRKMEGLSQSQLAQASHISIACLRDIEHACANITIKKLLCVANAFGLSLTELSAASMQEEVLMDMIHKARETAGIARADGTYVL